MEVQIYGECFIIIIIIIIIIFKYFGIGYTTFEDGFLNVCTRFKYEREFCWISIYDVICFYRFSKNQIDRGP